MGDGGSLSQSDCIAVGSVKPTKEYYELVDVETPATKFFAFNILIWSVIIAAIWDFLFIYVE